MSPKKKTIKKSVAKGKPGTTAHTKKTTKKVAKKTARKAHKRSAVTSGKKEKHAELRKLLLGYRKKILRNVKEEISKFISGEAKQLVDTAVDDGDLSFVDLAEDINLKKLSSYKDRLNKIDESLRKLDEGTYGLCDDCGAEISEARLKVMPFAIHCVECKEQRERFEDLEKEYEF
ncbi:general stress protein 16O [bacterium BMS3Abin07]|nr:general stress protein 16O [bacterium BMS3Abin07]GBE31396.1 general stress protein 16O [bacterium BMS3Bbin05]HDL20213.1 TraR/DksA family transcriptional regulator [Nitrospirota bacterium]HDZ87051.1 TraR/DksA family transcriptional regulator [Nitrospirota bacterium]